MKLPGSLACVWLVEKIDHCTDPMYFTLLEVVRNFVILSGLFAPFMMAVSGLLPTPLFYCVRQYRCIWVEARQCLCVMCEKLVYIGILLRLGSNAITPESGSQVQSGSLPSCIRSGSVSSIADEGLPCLHVTLLSPTMVSSRCVTLPNFV